MMMVCGSSFANPNGSNGTLVALLPHRLYVCGLRGHWPTFRRGLILFFFLYFYFSFLLYWGHLMLATPTRHSLGVYYNF